MCFTVVRGGGTGGREGEEVIVKVKERETRKSFFEAHGVGQGELGYVFFCCCVLLGDIVDACKTSSLPNLYQLLMG